MSILEEKTNKYIKRIINNYKRNLCKIENEEEIVEELILFKYHIETLEAFFNFLIKENQKIIDKYAKDKNLLGEKKSEKI